MNKFNFWYKWITIVSALMIVLGIFIVLFNQSGVFNYIFNNQINSVFWASENLPYGLLQFQGWIYGVLGATLLGWGIFLLFIAIYPFKEKQKWSWTCILVSICSWYIIDTAISIYFRVYFNAAFNTIMFLAIATPLFFTRKFFNNSVV